MRRAIKKYKPLVVTLQETKSEKLLSRMLDYLWGRRNNDWLELSSNGASGGLVVILDPDRLNMHDTVINSFTISIHGSMVDSIEYWVFTGGNTLVQHEHKDSFWEEIDTVGKKWSFPWIIVGDFNDVRKRF